MAGPRGNPRAHPARVSKAGAGHIASSLAEGHEDPPEQTGPGSGRHYRGAPPVEQFDVELRLKLRDAGRDRRLRYRNALRAFRETASLGDRDEMFDLIELHG